MKVVRQWMTLKLLSLGLPFWKRFFFFTLVLTLSACNPTDLPPKSAKTNIISNDGSMDGKAFVYEDSPYALAGPSYSRSNVDMKSFLSQEGKLITTNNRLTSNCDMIFYSFPVSISDCIYSLVSQTSTTTPLPRNSDKTYIFPTNSEEFYQVNTLYHLNKVTELFFSKLNFAYEQAQSLVATNEPRSIPYYLMNSKLFWFKAMANIDSRYFKKDYLTSYSKCDEESNAYFIQAGPEICFGTYAKFPSLRVVQDPSVIYHEMGHALVSIMLNMRNGTSSTNYHPFRSGMGGAGYDEAGAINEGIADYFSYMMNKRERFAEWAFNGGARPISEADSMHTIPGIDETSAGRLSYPQYLMYDARTPNEQNEEVHSAGQVASHYFVALTKSLKSECGYSSDDDGGHKAATDIVFLLIAETLSELGDLNAKGIDNFYSPLGGNAYFTNLDSTNSFLWTQTNNTISYRRFFQTFAKNINKYVSYMSPSRIGLCPSFDKNKSERLLDDYGILLFRTYNDNGTSTKSRSVNYGSEVPGMVFPLSPTPVSENNRRKSVLISKQLIQLATKTDTNPSRVGFYIIDNSSDIEDALKNLIFKGVTVPISTNVAGTVYNNNNIKISPGEIIGIIPNLLNNSNSTMAGVQLLSTDWDHVHVTDTTTGNFKPCVLDTVTTTDQGGEAGQTCTTTEPNYRRLVQGNLNTFPASAVAPVCMVQMEEGDSTRWVSQNEFRKKQGLSLLDKDCLSYTSSSSSDQDFTFNPHECLVRFLPNANSSFFSKIGPQKTYYETAIKDSSSGRFNMGNVMLMEINKWVPPGTKFRCRLRARFSNCSDCFNDGSNADDDFIDAEFNGSKPFKIINFEFDVND
jgi:hypothetical protein